MSSLFVAILAIVLLPASLARADCNPPPPGLSFQQWTDLCPDEIDYAYSLYGADMDYDTFVRDLYGMYRNPPAANYGSSGVTPLAQCSPDGATQCNSSGWLYTCTNGQWLTGSVKCGG